MATLTVRHLETLDPASSLGERWDALTRENSATGFMQSLHWAAFKTKQGVPSLHLGLFDGEDLIGGGIFYTSGKRQGASILVAPEGPVLPWDNRVTAARGLGLLMEAIEERSQDLGIMSMRVEPRLAPPVPPLLREFGRAPLDLIPRETLYIDLSGGEEAVLAGMKPKGRYNIKLAARSGVQISEATGSGCVPRFYETLCQAGRRDQFAVEPLAFFEHLAQVLMPSGKARFLFAEEDGDTLGALLLITHGQRATYLYGGISDLKRNLMGGYLLQWQAMKSAIEAGCTTYDFYGYVPFRSPEHRYARFSQFKSQFGGTPMRFIGGQDYFFLDNVVDAFVKVVNETACGVGSREEKAYV
jgi:peptidoglycan pentaglycine glycine transferase (the first glycine)